MTEQKIITVTSPLLPDLGEYNALLQDICQTYSGSGDLSAYASCIVGQRH